MSTNEGRIRVLIADDHAMLRRGLAAFLEATPDLELVGEADDGAQAIRRVAELQPDVVLMDLKMPGTDGITATRTICERFPETHILALTSFPEEVLVKQALDAGATGYLLKNVGADDLASAIRRARLGRGSLAPEAAQALIAGTKQKAPQGTDLSPREREVLQLMVQGLSNPDIAERLIVGRATIKFHVSSILGKLGASTRTEAVAMALQQHLV